MFFMPLPWGLRVTLVVCGFWGLFCFGLPGPRFFSFVVGVGLGFGLVFWTVCTDFGFWLAVCGWLGLDLLVLFGEFDPGSGRTLAACLTHASRTVKRLPFWWVWMSGERVSNT